MILYLSGAMGNAPNMGLVWHEDMASWLKEISFTQAFVAESKLLIKKID